METILKVSKMKHLLIFFIIIGTPILLSTCLIEDNGDTGGATNGEDISIDVIPVFCFSDSTVKE